MTAPDLDDASYDQTALTNQLAFLDVSKAKPLSQGINPSVETPDSSPNLLHVYHGYLSVVHPGEYEFRLDPSGIGEVTLGETVVARAGFPDQNISQPVILEAGLIPYEVKLAKGSGLTRWKGPGQDWLAIVSEDLVHEARPLISVPNREKGNTSYEIFGPTQVVLETEAPLSSAKLIYTLDASEPKADGTPYEQAFSIDKTTLLRARIFQDGKPVGAESSAQFTLSKTPAQRLLGIWPAEKFDGKVLPNQLTGSGAASDLILPDGTKLIDDPQRGKALSLDHSSKVMMSNPAILDNELTLAYWINTQKSGGLTRYGYGNNGFSLDLQDAGSIRASGGGSWEGTTTKGGLVNDGKWHHVAATFGGKPVRQIQIYVDGELQGSGRNKAPCITQELEFLQGFTGLLSEMRMYNRILEPDEIKALAKP